MPSSTDICQTWSNVVDGRVNLFVELDSDAPLTGLSPAILGFQFDLDFDATTTPERCSGCAHGFTPHPDDELAADAGDGLIWIGFEEYIYLQAYMEQDGSHLLDLSTTFEVECADVRRSGRVLWVSFPRERIDAEAFRLSVYTYGDVNATPAPYPDLASGEELFYESNSGAPDIDTAEFTELEGFVCVPRLN